MIKMNFMLISIIYIHVDLVSPQEQKRKIEEFSFDSSVNALVCSVKCILRISISLIS